MPARSRRLPCLCQIAVAAWISACGVDAAIAGERISVLDVVRMALAKNPDVQLQQKQVEISGAVLQQTSGQFDPVLKLTAERSINNTPLNKIDSASYLGASEYRTETTTVGLALEKTLRNGVVLGPTLSTTSKTDTLSDLQHLDAQNQGDINFRIRVPVLKGSGEAVVANESAANLEWEASKQDLRFVISKSILNVVSGYWGLMYATKNLEVAKAAEMGIQRMVEDTQKLIDADELPAADLVLIKANLKDKTTGRIAAELDLRDAQLRLGEAIGLSYAQSAVLEPGEQFPAIDLDDQKLNDQTRALIDLAMKLRPDLVAAQLREDSARTLTRAAQSNMKSQLDVSLSLGYTGLSEGGGSSALLGGLDQNRGGLNVGASISYQWPFDNNTARGQYRQQAALYDQSSIRLANIGRSIGVGVESALTSLSHSLQQLKESEETVELYRISLENEKTKHLLGTATIVDVLATNDRYLIAQRSYISYRINTLNALARLNYETGALLADDKSGESIQLDRLIGVPKQGS